MKTKPEKYTQAFVAKETKDILEYLENNPQIVFKGELFLDREYSRSRYHEWAKKFKNDDKISCAIKKIDELLETRAFRLGLSMKNPAFIIFHLKNNFNWRDQREHTIQGGDHPIKITVTDKDTA